MNKHEELKKKKFNLIEKYKRAAVSYAKEKNRRKAKDCFSNIF